jgi:ankyrin repeat protein
MKGTKKCPKMYTSNNSKFIHYNNLKTSYFTLGNRNNRFSNHHDDGTIHQVDQFGDMPLTWACMKGDNEMIDILVDAGADIQAMSEIDGDTPLHRAVKYGHFHAARHLLLKVKEKEHREHLNLLLNFVSNKPEMRGGVE